MPSLQEHGEELRGAAILGDLEEMVRLLNLGADINGADEVRLDETSLCEVCCVVELCVFVYL